MTNPSKHDTSTQCCSNVGLQRWPNIPFQTYQLIPFFLPSHTILDSKPILSIAGMQIHIRPVARGDKNYVRAIVNQHVTSPAGD